MPPTDWLTERQRDGGIDRIPLPVGVPGELRLCGKHAIAAGRFDDPAMPWTTVVCLCERFELSDRYPDYVAWLDAAQADCSIWWPIPDLHAPSLEAMVASADELAARLGDGDRLLVHCAAGMGRTGTTAASVLIRLGLDDDDALTTIDRHRPGAGPQTAEQGRLVAAVAASTAKMV